MLNRTFIFILSPYAWILRSVACQTIAKHISISKASWAEVTHVGLFGTLITRIWQGISTSVCGWAPARHRRLFYYIRFLLELFDTLIVRARRGISTSGHGRVLTRYSQLFCYIGFLLGLLRLVSIVFINIKRRSSTHEFKDDICNLHSGLSICYNFSTDVLLTPCLASFNHYLTRNINLST